MARMKISFPAARKAAFNVLFISASNCLRIMSGGLLRMKPRCANEFFITARYKVLNDRKRSESRCLSRRKGRIATPFNAEINVPWLMPIFAEEFFFSHRSTFPGVDEKRTFTASFRR